MKRILLLSFGFVLGISLIGQNLHIKKEIPIAKRVTEKMVAIDPVKASGGSVVAPTPSNTKATNTVNVVTIGTSANAYGYGYNGGQKTLVWADDALGVLINIHRMGPGTTPPGLSGHLAVDKGINKGMTAGDWTLNYQIAASTLNNGGDYYLDANRYPQAVLYNPAGNTNPDNTYIHFFCPNLSNVAYTWGGYTYGVCNWADQADSTKHLDWYASPPYQYIPDGMMLTHSGVSIVSDLDRNWESGSGVYMGDIIMNRGVWNDTEKDFVYDQFVVPLPTLDDMWPANNRIAASPDGNDMWMVTLANNGGTVPVGGWLSYYPILHKSNDAGVTWSDPIAVQIDGPNGIDGIKNALSDYRLTQIYGTLPNRDDVPYTTAFDCDLVVDKWGNPHIAVVVGINPEQDYYIATGDSNCTVFDIYSVDGGNTWQAQKMGTLQTFQGTFGTLTEDNRVNMAINEAGDHVFLTWLDTHVEGAVDNNQPDVFARGFNLLTNMITSNAGEDNSDNVTFLSDVYQQAFFEATSYYVFSIAGDGHTIPIVTELLTDNDDTQPVTFKYISDFSYMPDDYTIPSTNPPFPVGINDDKKEMALNARIFPNPVYGTGTLTVNLKESGNLSIDVTNMVGQKVMSFNKGFVNAGSQQFSIDANGLQAGVYFYTIKLNDQKFTNKMVVK